jgi:hypothetical protein
MVWAESELGICGGFEEGGGLLWCDAAGGRSQPAFADGGKEGAHMTWHLLPFPIVFFFDRIGGTILFGQ